MFKNTLKKNLIAGLLVTIPAALTYMILSFVITRADKAMKPVIAGILGSQNIKDRHSLNLGFAKTAPLPTGFVIGVSLITGIISGGSMLALLLPEDFP